MYQDYFNKSELKQFRHNFKKGSRKNKAEKYFILKRKLSDNPDIPDKPLTKSERRFLLN